MRDYTDPPAYAEAIADLARRVASLERSKPDTPVDHRVTATFTAFPSVPYRPPAALQVTDLWADSSANVGADNTFTLSRDGTVVGTVTIASGQKHGQVVISPPISADVFNVLTVERTAGGDAVTVQAIGTSGHPITPSLGGPSLPKGWCGQGSVSSTNPTGTTVTGPDTSAHASSYFLVLVALTITNGTGGAATPSLSGYIVVGGSSLTQSPWSLPQQTMANNDRIVTTMPCIVEAGNSVDFHIADANTSGCGIDVGITVVEVDSVTGACCTAPG